MDISNFFRMAVYICILTIIFTLAINFVSGLGIFPSVNSGVSADLSSGNPSAIFESISGFSGGMAYLWLVVTTISGLAVIVIAKIVGSTNIIGIWLFSEVFWTSYNRAMVVVNVGSFVPGDFLIMFTVALMFIWIASIISMFTSVS